MQLGSYTDDIREKLKYKKWIVQNGLFIKRKKGNSYIETIYLIDKNREKLTDSYFAFLDYIFSDGNEVIKAFGGTFYDDYQDYCNLYKEGNVDMEVPINECIEGVLELDAIGVNYTDVHAKNIIVNMDGHMRLVDLDEAPLAPKYHDSKVFLFVDLILETYLFYDIKESNWNWIAPRSTIQELESKRVLSKPFLSAISNTIDDKTFYANVNSFIKELKDEEKNLMIRKELKEKHPNLYS